MTLVDTNPATRISVRTPRRNGGTWHHLRPGQPVLLRGLSLQRNWLMQSLKRSAIHAQIDQGWVRGTRQHWRTS